MRGQHYSVNGVRFTNFYTALRYSAETNAFAEYVIPREHLDAFESVKVKDFQNREPNFFIKEKIAWIFKTYDTQRLHYSGGSDSHTILQIANQLNQSNQKFFDNRCGVDGTIHRISRRVGQDGKSILGFTMRFGKMKKGITRIISDLIAKRKSVLFIGRPGVGKIC